MSLTSKVTLGASLIFTSSIIAYVHIKQKTDRESLRVGVIRDLERQNMKRTANIKAQQDQIELTKALKARRDAEDLASNRGETNTGS